MKKKLKVLFGGPKKERRDLKKLLLMTKLTLLLIFFSVIQAIAVDSYAQMTRLSLKIDTQPLEKILDEIEDKSEFFFLYNKDLIDVEQKVSVEAQNEPIKAILDEVLDGKNIAYTVYDRQIVLSDAGVIKKMVAQQKSVSGKVTDSSGLPLPGVTVVVKGTTNGTVTSVDGEYSLSNIPEEATLQFSFVGMKAQEILVDGKAIINVEMEDETIGLEEVVAIGYGTQKKETVSGAISTVKGDDLKQSPALNFSSNLVGRMSGIVSVTQSGEPGNDSPTIQIRGSNTLNDNSPLIVIDGISNRSMAQLDPADIESVTVLKDASAAIYGAQAANGVVIITTKRGSIGKPEIKVNFNQGFSQPTRIPEMANAPEYATMLNEINYYRGRAPLYTEEEIQKFGDGSDPWRYPNTDWFDETLRNYTPQNYGNLSVSGGTENMKYFVSLGAKYQDGIYKKSATKYSQYNFRSNLDGKITDNINFSIDISGRQEDRQTSTNGEDRIYWMLVRGKPTFHAYWPDGRPGPDLEYGENPVVIATNETGYDREKKYLFESNIKLNATIPWVKGLSLTGNLAVDKVINNYKRFQKPWYLYTWDEVSYDNEGNPLLVRGKRGIDDPNLTQRMNDRQNITANLLMNYTTKFRDTHGVNVLFGVERNEGDYMGFEAYRRYFVSDVIDELFAGGDREKNNNGESSLSARLNYFGRVNYNFKEKYLVDFVWRYDGSYIFPEEGRYGFFPGVSLAWRVSEEDFWNDNFIQSLKIRGSWGQTGNDRVDPYQYLTAYAYKTGRIIDWEPELITSVIFNGESNKVLAEQDIPNTQITWEVANQSNIGFDMQALGGKLYFESDYFYNLRTKILIERSESVPATAGFELPAENIGKVVNQGFEALARYSNQTRNGLNYSISVNASYQHNKIKFWDEAPGAPEWQKSTGHPMGSELYYKALGIFHNQDEIDAYPHWENARPGDIKFEDVNGDKVIDGLDRVRIDKNSLPKFTGGLNVDLEYKGMSLSMLLQGAAGAVNYISGLDFIGEVGNYYKEFVTNRWTEDNPTADYPRTWNREEEYWTDNQNTFFLRSTNYIRLKNLELGYNFPNSVIKPAGIEGLRVYVNGSNLLTIDKFNLFDPEVTNYRRYPNMKTINVGFTVTL